jgi:predicted transposase YdaD
MKNLFYTILDEEFANFRRGSKFYRYIKEKMQEKGHWKAKKRGNPEKGKENIAKINLQKAYSHPISSQQISRNKNSNNDYVGADGFPEY